MNVLVCDCRSRCSLSFIVHVCLQNMPHVLIIRGGYLGHQCHLPSSASLNSPQTSENQWGLLSSLVGSLLWYTSLGWQNRYKRTNGYLCGHPSTWYRNIGHGAGSRVCSNANVASKNLRGIDNDDTPSIRSAASGPSFPIYCRVRFLQRSEMAQERRITMNYM